MNRWKQTVWRWVAPLMGLLFVVTAAALLPGCGASSDNGKVLGQACEQTSECVEGLECRGKKCRTPLENNPPLAIASVTPTDATIGQKIDLDGTSSSDPENQLLSYKWTLTSIPDGSQATIVSAEEAKTSFVPDLAGEYKIQLEVSDGTNSKKSVEITVSVKEGENTPPVANAGKDQRKEPGEEAQLDGSESKDPDGGELTYQWRFVTKPEGSQANIEKPDTAKPTFKTDKEGRYIIELEVTDSRKAVATDRVTVEVMKDLYLKPTVASVAPAQGTIETVVDVVIKGDGFAAGAKVVLGPKEYETTFVSKQELKASLDLGGQTPGDESLSVMNPSGEKSAGTTFKVLDIPTPELTKLDPEFSFTGVKSVEVKVIGKNFVSTSEVLFAKTPLKTTFKSETELVATLDLSQTPTGEYEIGVRSPGGRVAATQLKFKVLDEMLPPVLNVLNPPNGNTNTKIDFSVHGTAFAEGAVIVFDGKDLPSKRIRRDEIQVDGKLDLTGYKDGEYKVHVRNPDGNKSKEQIFNVIGINPTPTVDRVLPFNVYIGTVTTLAIYGSRFNPKTAKFFIDKTEYTVNRQRSSATYLEVKIDTTTGTWKSGDFDAYVVNPGATPQDDRKSKPFKLTITHPTPSIDAITPGGWSLGCDADVLVTGRNFVPASKLYFGSTVYEANPTNPEFKLTIDPNGTKMTFKVLKKNLSLTTYQVYITNGPSAKSSTIPFPIRNNTDVPSIREIRPAVGAADTVVSTLMYYNYPNYFRPGSIAYLDGKVQATSCRLSSSNDYCYDLTVAMDLTGFKPGEYDVKVGNPCGKSQSAALKFLVTPPPDAYLSQIVPSYAKVGEKKIITIKGDNFSNKASIYYGTKKLDIVYKSGKEITTKDPIDFSTKGTTNIYVDNGNGKKTAEVPFSVFDPNPKLTITQLSLHSLKRGSFYNSIIIQGTGFTKNSKVFLDSKLTSSSFQTSGQITMTSVDFRTIKAGTYMVYVEDNGVKSNIVPIFAEPLPPPSIRYLSPASIQVGKSTSTYLYVYGDGFCTGSSRCSTNPTVTVTGPDKKDYSSKFTINYTYSTYVRGTFNLSGLAAGGYQFRVALPTGEKSQPGIFQLTPPPPPVATSVTPPVAFRGNDQQQVSIVGSNLVKGDFIIFNNDTLNPLVGTSSSATQLNATIDLSKIKYAGKYPLYVKRCLDQNCTKFEKSAEVFLNVQDPPCLAAGGVQCSTFMKPAGSEACAQINGQQVCRPTCKVKADCSALKGAPSSAACAPIGGGVSVCR